jgi:hypothetical protein
MPVVYPVPVHSRPPTVGPYSVVRGPVQAPAAGEDHNTTGLLVLAVSAQATVTKDSTVTGRLLVGAALLATVTTTKDSTGHLPVAVFGRPGTAYRYPASISGNKVLDQFGDVFLLKTFSSWSMPSHLSDADIVIAVGKAAALGFNGITCWMGGTEDRGGAGWDKYTNLAADNYWTGTPWAMDSGTTLGPAWSSVDKVVVEADKLGIIVSFSFCSGFSTFGPGPDWDAATNADMTAVGEAIASRYAAYDNIVWHVMYDDNPSATRIARTNALFTGINNIEGTSRRPVRWTEVDNGFTTFDRSLYDPTGSSNASRFSVNCIYDYSGSSVVAMENARTEITTGPIGDCEPRYVDNTYTTGNNGQQLRERNYSVFIEGGVLINFGHECWWPFGADPLIGGCVDWEGVVDVDTETLEAEIAWAFVDTWMLDSTFEATSAFIDNGATGEGTGDAKAAQGKGDAVALAYFPDNRTVTVDTTILTGTGNVRLRWFDPVANSYSTIAASEAQQTGRSVTLPAARGDGTRDFVLVADLVADVSVTGHGAVGTTPYATVTSTRDVAALLLAGVTAYAVPSKDVSETAILPLATEPVATVSHDATPVAQLHTGTTLHTGTVQHDSTPAAVLFVGETTLATVSGDRSVSGHVAAGVGLWGLIEGAVDVTTSGISLFGVAASATVSHDATADAVLPVPTDLRATVTHDADATGVLPVGTAQVATVSHISTATGSLFVGTSITSPVTGDVTVVGSLFTGTSLIRLLIVIAGNLTCDVDGPATARRLTGPSIVSITVTGPSNGTPAFAGPSTLPRSVAGPAVVARVTTGPALTARSVTGPEVSRDVTGPLTEGFGLTGPGMCSAD